MAVCLLESAGQDEAKRKEAAELMEKVPSRRQKIAGKSIPLEVHFLAIYSLVDACRNSWLAKRESFSNKTIG